MSADNPFAEVLSKMGTAQKSTESPIAQVERKEGTYADPALTIPEGQRCSPMRAAPDPQPFRVKGSLTGSR